ncbi:hypothetical protein MLD38_022369 [Melastoma candidum]|uniref:Uncharacterized protein n=1 Tax=Melastoma candidum TaxID=119954 RepID=A0ACB9QK20_9MYRT|nr:hypothetical protein MLD38_022369 [Melastoma candidum]
MSTGDQPALEACISLPDMEELLSLLLEPDPAIPNSVSEASNSNNQEAATYSSLDVDRKRKRMISNRESARRSRWRKKKRLEDLTDELSRLSATNWELGARLGFATHRCLAIQRENQRLRLECASLSAKLSSLRGMLIVVGARDQHPLISGINTAKTIASSHCILI